MPRLIVLAQVDGSRLLDQVMVYFQMIKLNSHKLEKQIKEILQNSSFASVDEYLIWRINTDHLKIKGSKKLI